MIWNLNSNKLILEWLANRTPPSCIRVNIISMTLTTNPNTDIANNVLCVKYIKNLQSELSMLTKYLAGKEVGSSVEVTQMHADATTHKKDRDF